MSRILFLVPVLILAILVCEPVHAAPVPVATFEVNSTADTDDGVCDGVSCTLREAINAANAGPGHDLIRFAIPGVGPHTIQPDSVLPPITDPVTIDGYTQTGAVMNSNGLDQGLNTVLQIELDGTNAGFESPGVRITAGASGSVVQGLAINRFEGFAIFLDGPSDTGILGNFIGTNVVGDTALPNLKDGIQLQRGSDNVIGGATPEAANLISGNLLNGVVIVNSPATRNLVQGNLIGTDISGTSAVGNGFAGVLVVLSVENAIGGTEPGEGNVISGNQTNGVLLVAGANGNTVSGNRVGTNAAGTGALGNLTNGVVVEDCARCTVGGEGIGGNTIAHNGAAGVLIGGVGSLFNRILSNSIFSNTGLGIDIGGDGPNFPQDPGDTDGGLNHLQNFPILSGVTETATGTTIEGALDSQAQSEYRIEFFASAAADPSGFGEGQTYLGSVDVDSNFKALIDFEAHVDPLPTGQTFVTATATDITVRAPAVDPTNDTSEFSPPFAEGGGEGMEFVVTNSADSGVGSLREALAAANASPGKDTVVFTIPSDDPGHFYYRNDGIAGQVSAGSEAVTTEAVDANIANVDPDWPHSWYSIRPTTPLPTISDPIAVDGFTQTGATANTNPFGQGLNTIPRVEINGGNLSSNFDGLLHVTGGQSSIKGLALNRNDGPCVNLDSSGRNRVEGCFLGPDISGTIGFPSPGGPITIGNRPGVLIRSSDNIVGGTEVADRNLISGNAQLGGVGVRIGDPLSQGGVTGNVVAGNLIGTDRSGERAVGNREAGVEFVESSGNTLGGPEPGAGNVISGNVNFGVRTIGSGENRPADNLIQGNYVGTNVTGASAIPNGLEGMEIDGFRFDVVGNTVAYNPRSGILIVDGTGNTISENSIHSNGFIEIDLEGPPDSGSSVNFPQDDDDLDGGPNNYQNFPVIASIISKGPGRTVEGTLDSAPNGNYRLEFFASTQQDSSGFGGGEVFQVSSDVATDAQGVAPFMVALPPVPPGARFITATATDLSTGDTSEFSGAFPISGCSFTVTSANDTGAGSLREAMLCANVSPGSDTIRFAIPGEGPHTIRPDMPLPPIIDPVFIDGFSQPGASANTNPVTQGLNARIMIELDGSSSTRVIDGFDITGLGSGSVLRGLAIGGFDYGVFIFESDDNRIEGCFVGVQPSGDDDNKNDEDGIYVEDSARNTIGGLDPGARNLISGNEENGIFLRGEDSTDNLVLGNLIGTDITGTIGLGNGDDAVEMFVQSSATRVGGPELAARNVCSGNGDDGIDMEGSHSNRVQNNYCGVDVTGTVAIGNGQNDDDGDAVEIDDAWNNRVEDNILSGGVGEFSDGVQLYGPFATGNVIRANLIGTDPAGVLDLGNRCEGVFVGNGASDNLVGGPDPGDGNLIAFHKTSTGVNVAEATSSGNAILGNSIHTNASLGIALGEDGVTPNDPGDADMGANGLQNYPVLTSVSAKGGPTTIEGTLNSEASNMYRIEFFANLVCDAPGHGEGLRFLGADTVTTNGSGNATINVALSEPVFVGEQLTSTATRIEGTGTFTDTSEFSECFGITVDTGPTPTPTEEADCPVPFPDFDNSGRADSVDLLILIGGIRDGDVQYDLTGDSMMDDNDFLKFSLSWYEPDCTPGP